MKNTILLFTLSLVLMACPKPNDETVSPQSNPNGVEVGNYISLLIGGTPDFTYNYNLRTNAWEWKYVSNYSFQPSRLVG
jgi:hypothetical protein